MKKALITGITGQDGSYPSELLLSKDGAMPPRPANSSYLKDAGRGVVQAVPADDKPAPVNLGSGREISIRDVAARIAGLIGFKGDFC
jgi:hypothetical protein